MTRSQNPSPHVRIEELQGLWWRSLFVAPDGAQDAATRVAWLQAPSFYADLRQPASSQAFDGVRALRDLDSAHVAALAMQDGFAGVLLQQGDAFEWTRRIDFRPSSSVADRGRLEDCGETMIEYGLEADYIEHWHREAQANAPSAALSLKDSASGADGMIVRVGPTFMMARSRATGLDHGRSLSDMVRDAPSLAHAQDLVDCELSLGRITHAWTIERSSLPYRVDAEIEPHLDGETLTTSDVSPDGRLFRRTWTVIEREGDVVACFGPTTR